MPVLRTLLDVRKMCVNEPTLNMRYSIYMFMYVAHFPVYFFVF